MTNSASDKTKRELSAERDFPVATPIARRYCILSSPRSGSTLLGRMLSATQCAGDPLEYFNPRLIAYERRKTANPSLSLDAFIADMERRRTSPNGVFGMKMHYSQMLGAFASKVPTQQMLAHLKQYGRLIWIRRHDRLRQAVSQAIGLHTQVWSSEDGRFGSRPPAPIPAYACVDALRAVCHEDFGWARLIEATGLEVLEVWFEDLVANYAHECKRVIAYLDLADAVPDIPQPQLQSQTSELNAQLHAELLAYLGVADRAP